MDALLAWYLAVFLGFGASVRHTTRAPESKPPHVRKLPPWLADITAYAEPIEGYQDPLFLPEKKEEDAACKKS